MAAAATNADLLHVRLLKHIAIEAKPPPFRMRQLTWLLCTPQATDNGVAGNLYAVKWSPAGRGFVLGNDAILLRHL